MSDSILDRVLSVKHAEEAARFVPHEILQKLLEPLTSREREVLTRRFGLSGKEQETLEKIGESYEVTRERIRQIERLAIQRMKDSPSFVGCISVVEHVIVRELDDVGGVLDTTELLNRLVAPRDCFHARARGRRFVLAGAARVTRNAAGNGLGSEEGVQEISERR